MANRFTGLINRVKSAFTGWYEDVPTPYGYFTLTSADLSAYLAHRGWGFLTAEALIDAVYSFSEVFTPADHIAKRVAGLKFIVVSAATMQPKDDKYLQNLLTSPNALQSFEAFMYESIMYEIATGMCFTYAHIADGLKVDYRNISKLENLSPQLVSVTLNSAVNRMAAVKLEDYIKGYRYQGYKDLTPDRVLYSRNDSLKASDKELILGISPLAAASKAMTVLNSVYEARHVIYDKRGALGFITSAKSDVAGTIPLTPDERKAALDVFHSTYGVKKSKSPIAVVDAPISYTKINADIKDLMPHEETALDATEIANVLRVPREMYMTEGVTYENQKEAEKRLYTSVVIPMAVRKAAELTKFLGLDKVGLMLYVDTTGVDVLHTDRLQKAKTDSVNAKTYKEYFLLGQYTLNDIRNELNLVRIANSLYDKLVFDMTPEEQAVVLPIIQNIKTQQNDQAAQPQA